MILDCIWTLTPIGCDRKNPSEIGNLCVCVCVCVTSRSCEKCGLCALHVAVQYKIDFVKDGDGLRSCSFAGRPTYKA